MPAPELIADYACSTGESPMWHPLEQALYWADIPRGVLFRYDPSTGESGIVYEGELVGGYTVQADGALLCMMKGGAARIWRKEFVATPLAGVPAESHTRFKDCVADPRGRVYVGTVGKPDSPGRLYRIEMDGKATRLVDHVLNPNGMGFSPDRLRFYLTDSIRSAIYRYDYDECSGAIANQRLWSSIPASEGVPDGMTVDAEGCVWSARWGGGCVVRYDPSGAEMTRICFPAVRVSSCIIGGADYGDLYVTTAGGQDKDAFGAGAGALFRVDLRSLGVRGLPEYLSRVGLEEQAGMASQGGDL